MVDSGNRESENYAGDFRSRYEGICAGTIKRDSCEDKIDVDASITGNHAI